MKKDILFLGIGQGGSNIAYEMQNRGFTSCYINTTIGDIKDLNINRRFIYHIPGATGCARDRIKALDYAKEYFNTIDTWLNTDFSVFENIYICFATGGGSGSGISPALLSILAKKYPSKNFGAIAILPSSDESIMAKKNAVECFEQIKKISPLLKNIIFLDNNSIRDKKKINTSFADDFDNFINIPNLNNVDGNIDADEIQKLISMSGNVVFGNIEYKSIELNKIYPVPKSDCKGAFIINGTVDTNTDADSLLEPFGKPIELFTCTSTNSNKSVGIFGLSLPTKRVNEIIEEIKEDSQKILQQKNSIQDDIQDFEMPDFLNEFSSSTRQEKREIDKAQDIDLDEEFAEFF